jgi:1,4-dihydroxy-2-naphthoate octaprenyltransferase
MPIKNYFLETRPQFLILSLVLAILGTGMALADGYFNPGWAVLLFVGLLLLHVSVNTLNDYFDYKSGIDLVTTPTPFSGGSGVLPSGTLTPKAVLVLGLSALVLAVPIGMYFVSVRGTVLLPLFIAGAILVLLYTTLFTKIGWGMSEFAAGLGLGTLPVFGIYYIMTGAADTGAIYASVPSGFLVANLLLLNEFPDAEADKKGNRKTLPITIGKRGAAVFYTALTIFTYLWIVAGVVLKLMPAWTLLGCLTIPLALKAIAGAFDSDNMEKLVPAQGANVMVVLITQLLMGIGYLLFYFLRS